MEQTLEKEIKELVEKLVKEKMEKFGEDIANFEKVSFEQFYKDCKDLVYNEDEAKKIYDKIQLPTASTLGSSGFDFVTPFEIALKPKNTVLIPTGIRCKMDKNWALLLLPRSGHGTKYRVQLNNTIGLIDEDYYFADNEGHIMAKITNDTNENKNFCLDDGNKFIQGMFVYTGKAKDAILNKERKGGFGSTGN